MSVGRLRAKLFGFLAVVVALVAFTLVQGNTPLLGLDLQGGISVVLEPVGDVKPGSLDVAVDIIRSRVDGLGVAEPEISRQGGNIVVDLPGVDNRDKARRLVGQTAELRFRPVLAQVPAEDAGKASSTTTSTTTPGGSTPTTTAAEDTTTPTTAAEGTTTPTTVPDDAAAKAAVASCDAAAITALTKIPTTGRADDARDVCVVLPLRATDGGASPGRLLLGPTTLTGNDVDKARSRFQNEYLVLMTLTGDGLTKFNQLASTSYGKTSPQDQVAIVLDGVVQSNPAFQSSTFDGDVSITGNFTATEASDLAKLINYGALPVQLQELTVQNVSPTLGKDQLSAGIIAGVIGLVLVSIYILVYYRILGLVVIAGILISGALLLVAVTSFIGEAVLGLLGGSGRPVLTLAGVTGLIVSIGVTVDSYIVYFERLKDEVRSGRTVRTSADRGFTRSFRTILAADLVSFLGAAILFLVAVGSVKGFAFFLGLSTVLDLLVSYFFMHPLVSLMARRQGIVRNRVFGIAAGLDAPEATA
ncbi:MAG: protein translocase subunit SecD [Actinomycetota bacterium]